MIHIGKGNERMSVKCELFFFILDARGDLHTTAWDRVIFNCVITYVRINEVAQIFCFYFL